MTTRKAGEVVSSDPAADTPPGTAHRDEIRADIERTRSELGDSVEALAARADVKARAQENIAAAKMRARDTAQMAKERAKDTAHVAKARAKDTAHVAKEGAKDTAHVAKESAKSSAQQMGRVVRRKPVPVAVSAGLAGMAGIVLLRRRRAAKVRASRRRWRTR